MAATTRFRHPRRDMALSAAAGPAANLLLAYVYTVLYKLVGYLAPANTFWVFVFVVLSTMVNVNITLAVFNLLPVPPLDGSRIFNLLLPKKWYFAVMRYERIILLALFAVLFLGLLDVPLNWLYTAAGRLLDFSTGYVELALRALLH